MRPGVDVISRAQPLPRSAPTDTGAAFMLGATTSGPDFALVRSITEYEATFGARTGFTDAYDAADAYFREGGAKLTVSRLNPTTPLAAVPEPPPDLSDAALAAMTRAELDTLAGSLGVVDAASLATKDDVIAAIKATTTDAERQASAEEHDYVAALAAADPTVAAALTRLTADLGPGQLFIADATLGVTPDTHSALLASAAETNRIALLSPADGDAASLLAAAAALQIDTNARYGALFAPSAIIPGVAAGTTRTVPYAAIQAGIIGRNDATVSPNVPSAGDLGQAVYATDLTTRYTDAEYQDLNAAGVDMARIIWSGVRTYGYRTLVDPASPDGVWLSLGNARLNMAIVAQSYVVGEHYVFTQLDGRRRTISQFGGALRAMLVPYYEGGSLYGETADAAFQVDVGQSVNTEDSIAAGELRAVMQVRMSPFAEWVVIEIVKVATTQAIAA